MNNYTREDILRMVEEEDVGFILSSVHRYVWNFEKCSNHQQPA